MKSRSHLHRRGQAQVAIDAAEAADEAYNLISDSSITQLRDDAATREKVAALVTRARDSHRRARSFAIRYCGPRALYHSFPFGRRLNPAAKLGRDPDPFEVAVPGRKVSLIALVLNVGGSIGTVVYVTSSRGRTIMEVPSCGREWRGYAPNQPENTPDSVRYEASYNQVHREFAPLLVGDVVSIDDIVVRMKR